MRARVAQRGERVDERRRRPVHVLDEQRERPLARAATASAPMRVDAPARAGPRGPSRRSGCPARCGSRAGRRGTARARVGQACGDCAASSASRHAAAARSAPTSSSERAMSAAASRPDAAPKSSTAAWWRASRAPARSSIASREPRLADAGVAAQRDRAPAPGRGQRVERGIEVRELARAADHPVALRLGRPQRAHAPHGQLLREAAHGDASARFGVEARAERRAHVVGHDRLAGAGELLEPRGQIDRVAGHRVVGAHRAAGRRRDDLAARDADVRRERLAGLGGQRRHRVVDLARGAHRALDVVAVRDRRAEHRHRRVADVLVDACRRSARSRRRRARRSGRAADAPPRRRSRR